MIKMRKFLWRVCHKNVGRIKIIDSDGSVGALEDNGITVSQLMQRYPQRIVSHANSFYIGQKVPVLSSGEKLESGQSYFLLPEKMEQTILSAAWLASLARGSKDGPSLNRKWCVMSVESFEIEKREDGRLQLKILPEFIQKVLENGRRNTQFGKDDCFSQSGLCSTPELQKDYEQMVKGRGQAWKPRLEPIVEKRDGFKLFSLKRKRRT